MDTTESRLFAVVQQELGIDPRHITAGSHLADLGDSLDRVNLFAAIEENFDIDISTESSLSLATVDDVIRLLKDSAHV